MRTISAMGGTIKDDTPVIAREGGHEVVETSWGRLVWHVSAGRGNSQRLTTGLCFINPGAANDRHLHPECEEVLTVIGGRIAHSWNDQTIEMEEGDVIVIAPNVVHNARNIGDSVAELAIVFSSAHRTTLVIDDGEEAGR